MKSKSRGFTLTEVLLVSVMFAVISLAVFNAFSNGFKLWARGQHVMVESDMAIFLDRISEDLRGVVLITGIPFKGDSTGISLPAIVLGPLDTNGSRSKEETGDQIGAVQYKYDPAEKKIYRSQANYGQALKSDWGAPVEVASLVEDMSVRYYFKADKGLDEKSQADGTAMPLGVLIDIQFMVDGQIRHMHRFMIIPVGGGI